MLAGLHFEDFTQGQQFTARGCTPGGSRIPALVRDHRPQPLHIGRIEAGAGPFGERPDRPLAGPAIISPPERGMDTKGFTAR